MTNVPTNKISPIIAIQSSPFRAKPTTATMAHKTRRTMTKIIMVLLSAVRLFVSVRQLLWVGQYGMVAVW
jgi:hypothetical protein